MSDRKPPMPLYPCVHDCCAEEQTWPADDLWWSENAGGYVCDMCWCDDPTHEEEEKGQLLSDELKHRAREHERNAIASHIEGLHDHCPLDVQDGARSVLDWLLEEADRIRGIGGDG